MPRTFAQDELRHWCGTGSDMTASENRHKVPSVDDMPVNTRLLASILRSDYHVPEVHRGTAPRDLVAAADQAFHQAQTRGHDRGCVAPD